MQSLYMTKFFRQQVLTLGLPSLKHKIEDSNNPNNAKLLLDRKRILIIFQIQKLFALLHSSQRDAINPGFFKAILPDYFRESHAQQDTAEFGRTFLDQLEDSFKLTTQTVK
jgi:hypothetical protein